MKKGKRFLSHRYNRIPLLPSGPGDSAGAGRKRLAPAQRYARCVRTLQPMAHFNVTSTHGLIGAALNFALLMVLYLLNMNLLAEWWVGICALLILVVFMFTGTAAARQASGGLATFGQAWIYSMSVALVAQVGSAALTLLLYQVIAPELPGVLAEITLDKTREMMEGFGMSGDMLNAQMKEIKEAMDEAYTLKGLAKNSAGGMLMWAVVSLIVAAISKRSPASEFS